MTVLLKQEQPIAHVQHVCAGSLAGCTGITIGGSYTRRVTRSKFGHVVIKRFCASCAEKQGLMQVAAE